MVYSKCLHRDSLLEDNSKHNDNQKLQILNIKLQDCKFEAVKAGKIENCLVLELPCLIS